MNWVTFNYAYLSLYVFVMLSILQSQFSEKGFKKTEYSEQNVMLLLLFFTQEKKKGTETAGYDCWLLQRVVYLTATIGNGQQNEGWQTVAVNPLQGLIATLYLSVTHVYTYS